MQSDIKNKWEEFYSKSSDPYGHLHWFSEAKRIENSLRILKEKKLRFENTLELGSGIGLITNELLSYSNKITCVEISSNAVKNAKKRLSDNLQRINFVVDDMYSIDFKENSFDFICALEALDYTKEFAKEIAKWKKWLKPDGIILFSGPNLKGYFKYRQLLDLFPLRDFIQLNVAVVTAKTPIQWAINRHYLPQLKILWSLNIFLGTTFPSILAKHVAFLIKSKDKDGKID